MQSGISTLNHLEPRRLFATAPPVITSFYADNRGEMAVVFDRFVRGADASAVTVTTAGGDGDFGTGDDVTISNVRVKFNDLNNRMTINAFTPVDVPYRLQLNSTLLTNKEGRRLDGEFLFDTNGVPTLPSGNKKPGGDFAAVANLDDSDRPQVRLNTTIGAINMRLLKDLAPTSAANFLSYANSGRYDGTFFTRSAPGFIAQGGALRVRDRGEDDVSIVQDVMDAGIAEEALISENSNLTGTLAFARSGPNNLATNQFFFNLADNTQLDAESDFEDTFYTPFALPVSDADKNIIAQLGQRPRADLTDEIPFEIPGGVSDAPLAEAINEAGFGINENLLQIRRVAVRMIVAPGA